MTPHEDPGNQRETHRTKSTTLKLVEAVLEGAEEAGAETKPVDLCSLKIDYCDACGVCYKKGCCVHKDYFGKVYDEMMASDGRGARRPWLMASPATLLRMVI
ncbi:MAG TPA: flavodoxin family protein [Methanothrix sp.]|nr:flavodoxin family protein [Methanothrix sp.]HPJ83179.1 flavodoxin family protein [Methanothrix sp.]HPR67063.1 flavodoxin family protein [Methanothrix sp.]